MRDLTHGLPAAAQPTLDQSVVERAAAEADLHSVLVWQSGRLLIDRRSKDKAIGDWFDREVTFYPDVLRDLRSISKSVASLLVGQAVPQAWRLATEEAGSDGRFSTQTSPEPPAPPMKSHARTSSAKE